MRPALRPVNLVSGEEANASSIRWRIIRSLIMVAPRGAVGPASAAGSALAAGPPHAGHPGQAQMLDRPWKGADLANAVANNESGQARTRLELPSHHGGVPAGRMDNDGRIWTNLILLRVRRLGFESLRARPGQRPLTPSGRGPLCPSGSHAGSHRRPGPNARPWGRELCLPSQSLCDAGCAARRLSDCPREGLRMSAGYTPQQSFIASESRQLADADLTQGDQHAEEDHFAHVTGKTCESCGRPIEAGQAARRRGETEWAHDVCPVVTD